MADKLKLKSKKKKDERNTLQPCNYDAQLVHQMIVYYFPEQCK